MSNAFDVYKNALDSRPEIKAAQLRVESARKQLSIAKGNRFPVLSAGADYLQPLQRSVHRHLWR
jgi:outer membrane protein